jgi:hypothetical protein
MKLKNTTDLPDRFLRRLISWCCRQYKMPVRSIRAARFTKMNVCRYSGHCWYGGGGGRILIRWRDSDQGYPLDGKYPGRKNAPSFPIENRWDGLVHIVAHEIAHISRHRDGGSQREARIDGLALPLLRAFQANRDGWLAAWGLTPAEQPATIPIPAAPRMTRAERNEANARAKLAEWESKLARAKTFVRKYRAKVRRYDRIAAKRSATN